MLTIRNIELSRTFINGDYRKMKYATKAEVQIGTSYGSTAHINLTDDQTARAVAFILEMIREGLSVEMEKPAPIEDEPVPIEPVARDTADMEPL
jgi:hypothetical protein